MTQTRVVSLPVPLEAAEHHRTHVASLHSAAPRADDAATTFERHRDALGALLAKHARPGFLAVAVGSRGLLGSVWNQAGRRPRVATIGRHSSCDLTLPGDGEVSLRHLVLLVRAGEDGHARGRLFDLAATNPSLPGGGAMKSVDIGELAAIPVPGHWVFFIRTHEGQLPSGPVFAASVAPVARLPRTGGRLDFADGVSERLSGQQLSDGVLLGRYERCLRGTSFEASRSMSRVHAVLVEDRGDTILFDAGSTNGVLVNGDECRARILAAADEVSLGGVTFEWQPAVTSLATRAAPLLPPGVDDRLRELTSHPVFADWLLERGSRWGEWLAAELQGSKADAAALAEELEPRLLGPLGGLRERRWEKGVLVAAKLVEEVRLNWDKALEWPLWAGLRELDTDPSADDGWVRLHEAGVLGSLRATAVWSEAAVGRLDRHPQLKVLKVGGEQAISALVGVLPSLVHLEKLVLVGDMPEALRVAVLERVGR